MISLEKIAEAVQGTIDGDAGFKVSNLRSLITATPDSLSFFSESGSVEDLQQTRAGALLISPEDSHRFPGNKIVVQDPYRAYATLSYMFLPPFPSDGVHADAIIDASAVLGEGVSVGPLSTIGAGAELGNGVVIGNGTHIAAGVRMLSWLYRRLESTLPVHERLWFSLAAYNAGLGHLKDARRLAHRLGLDPDRWFDNVEQAMLLLSKPEYYRKARHGYVRGREPVAYVRDIRDLYDAYRSLLRS